MRSMINKKAIAVTALVLSLLFVGCSKAADKSDNTANESSKNNASTTTENSNTSENTTDDNKSNQIATQNTSQPSQEIQDITKKVKDYINGSQGNKAESSRIKWNKTFLDRVEIGTLYNNYVNNGGKKDDIESFAKYITEYAPIYSSWKDMIKREIHNRYKKDIVKFVYLAGDEYQAYIEKNGKQVPYVIVSARTGYYR